MKISFVVYRTWGYNIFRHIQDYNRVRTDFEIPLLITTRNPQFEINTSDLDKTTHIQINPKNDKELQDAISKYPCDIICFYSWSFFVPTEVFEGTVSLCLHPSMLPKYRGGTPIQNQLINGETDSGVTIFKMNSKIDGGDIYAQVPISLHGDVHDIFKRMVDVGTKMTKQLISDVIEGTLSFHPQNLQNTTIWNRRTPEQSYISFQQLKNMTFTELNNIIRGLLDPYPNAYIIINKKKLLILKVEKYNHIPENAIILSKDTDISTDNTNLLLKIKENYAHIVNYTITTDEN